MLTEIVKVFFLYFFGSQEQSLGVAFTVHAGIVLRKLQLRIWVDTINLHCTSISHRLKFFVQMCKMLKHFKVRLIGKLAGNGFIIHHLENFVLLCRYCCSCGVDFAIFIELQ